jgi:UDP-N-acetylmuramoyl-tripeptide--D-alanyl-D-alanine ligase
MKETFKNIITSIISKLANKALLKYSPFIIGVTGSVGKTTTKDAIAHVLEGRFNVRKSQKSFNSEIGLPLTILGLPNAWSNIWGWAKNIFYGIKTAYFDKDFPEVLVLEIGADKPGDIGRAMEWIHPFIGVLTRLPDTPVHVENFPTPELVREEKAKLIEALPKEGIFIANADDERVLKIAESANTRVLRYGFSLKSDVRGENQKIEYSKDEDKIPLGISMDVIYNGEKEHLLIKDVVGDHILSSALAAISTAVAKDMTLKESVNKLSSWETAQGRMRLIKGKNDAVIIDDSYNASPIAMHSALLTLKSIRAERKIAVLGDMLELGKYSEEEHSTVGRFAATFVDGLVVVGKKARTIAESAMSAGLPSNCVQVYANSVEAGEALSKIIGKGDVILVKGSQGSGDNMIRMERATKQMMANIGNAERLLVRQDTEWQKQYKNIT